MEIVCVPGVGGDHKVFAKLESRLKRRGLCVVSLSLPGHGETENPPDGLGIDRYIAFINEQITDSQTILIGHSLGADLVRRVALSNKNVIGVMFLAPLVRGRLLPLRVLGRMLCLHYIVPMLTGRAFSLKESDKRELFNNGKADAELEASFVPESGLALREVALGQFAFWRRSWPKRVKACVIAAEQDAIIPKSAARALARRCGTLLQVVRSASHMFLSDDSAVEQIVAIFFGWLTTDLYPTRPVAAE